MRQSAGQQTLDFRLTLREAIQQARAVGLSDCAQTLEDRAFHTAYTTSSELLGEVGEAIRQFRSRAAHRVPREVDRLLDSCLVEIGKVWPQYKPRPLARLLRRLGIPLGW